MHTSNYLRRVGIWGAVILLAGLPFQTSAAESSNSNAFQCPDFPAPIVSLTVKSRYKDGSESRSDLDVAANAEVDKVLKPADDFVRELTRMSKVAMRQNEHSSKAVDCAISSVAFWARSQAFENLNGMNANISYPSRIGGIAIVYAQLKPFMGRRHERDQRAIDRWLLKHAASMVAYWDNDAPRLAKKSNLRAWAALAVAQIGIILAQDDHIEWGLMSQRLILDTQDSDGSLPIEMRRGKYALHYQLHAVAPMVTASALLSELGIQDNETYRDKLKKAVEFSLRSIEDPLIVEDITKKTQTIKKGLLQQKKFTIAWIEPYLALNPNPALDTKLDDLRPLSNSKLGGNLTSRFQ